MRVLSSSTYFRLHPMNIRSSSLPMPPTRSSWLVRPIPFDPAVSSCSLPITTTPSMESASLHGQKLQGSRTCQSSRQNCVEMRPFSFHSLSMRGQTRIVCLPILPSRTSQASSIRSNGSQRLRHEGGMCCSMQQLSCPPIAWISPAGILTLFPFRSTRCSAIRQG